MIEDKILQIWKNRRDAISKFMDEYDAKVYNPQLEAIEKECLEKDKNERRTKRCYGSDPQVCASSVDGNEFSRKEEG